MYISKTETEERLRGEKENYLFNVTQNTASILITLGAWSLQVALRHKGMLEFPLIPSSDTVEGLF